MLMLKPLAQQIDSLASDRPIAVIAQFLPRIVALVLFGVLFQSSLVALAAGIPKRIFFETSYSVGLALRSPGALVLYLASVLFIAWLFSPWGRGRFEWSQIDLVGGLKWPVFAMAMTMAWAYSGYRYNYYFDQAHVWDRWVIVALLFATLRSPLLIPLFAFQVLVARAQFDHPLSDLIPIGDEMPLRMLGMVAGAAFWNGLLECLARVTSLCSGPMGRRAKRWESWARIETHALVYAILCTIGFYYSVAGLGKLMLGNHLLDWVRFSHMENLFVASYLQGWCRFLAEEQILAMARLIQSLHHPIAIMTLIIELGMAFIVVRQRGTLMIIVGVVLMHFGILLSSGIIFWKWLAFDVALLIWLWKCRENVEIQRIYSRYKAFASLLVIGGLIGFFGLNQFSWWNTKWTMTYEVEVLDESGKVYVVDHADFAPYTFFDPYKPEGRKQNTYVYGLTLNQALMEYFENSNSTTLKNFAGSKQGQPVGPFGAVNARRSRIFNEFMKRAFRHRNEHPGRSVPPFLFPSPSLHNRHLSGPNLYRDQSPVVEVRLRFREFYYTGDLLKLMRDEIVFSTRIAPSKQATQQD
jgi:hypothetical protein